MRERYFKRWKLETNISKHINNISTVNCARFVGFNISTNAITTNNNEMYDGQGNLILNVDSLRSNQNWTDQNEHLSCLIIRKSLIICVAVCLIGYGFFILTYTLSQIKSSQEYCSSVSESKWIYNINVTNITISNKQRKTLENNPELFAWDQCLYKVYPFTFSKHKKYKCQCRVIVINDWRDEAMKSSASVRQTYFNLTQQKMITSILENWFMLEKFRSVYSDHETSDTYIISTSMINAKKMKAFEWGKSNLKLPQFGFANWPELEYLKFEETSSVGITMPDDFNKLKRLKHLSLIDAGLKTFPTQICELTSLEILEFQWDKTESIPHCLSNLKLMKELFIDGILGLTQVPLSIFNLPNLYDLSLYAATISYIDLLEYNSQQYFDLNDTEQINEWFVNNFAWKPSADYWLQLNPICVEYEDNNLPAHLNEFVSSVGKCEYECETVGACTPILWGNGRCDQRCNNVNCYYDGGDCVQLCFAEQYSNCTYDLYTNDACDPECNNLYCEGRRWNGKWLDYFFSADNFNCYQPIELESNICSVDSIYAHQYKKCEKTWIDDGFCDDSCRIAECSNDGNDCVGFDSGIGCIDNVCATIFTAWSALTVPNIYLFNHSTVCIDWWQTMSVIFNVEGINCEEWVIEVDYNNDKQINFREFAVLAIWVFKYDSPDYAEWINKAPQVNCSNCIGTQYYNI